MTPKDWEQALAEAYWEHRWRQIMDPLCEAFQKWKADKLSHEEVNAAIDRAYEEKTAINSLLKQRQDRAAGLIRCWDPEWFKQWVEEHRPHEHIDTGPCE